MGKETIREHSGEDQLEGEKAEEVSLLSSSTRENLSSLREEIKMGERIKETIKSWLREGAEWLRDKISQNNDNVASVLVVILDELLERVRPDREDEFEGRQTREDLLLFAGGEEELAQMMKERAIDHKLNSLPDFEAAIQRGHNLEFDLRGDARVQHNQV